jgi:hypothetical protein
VWLKVNNKARHTKTGEGARALGRNAHLSFLIILN